MKGLYHYSKPLFFLAAGSLLFFVFVNLKPVIFATPLKIPGMYAAKYSLDDTLTALVLLDTNGNKVGQSLLLPEEDQLMIISEACATNRGMNQSMLNLFRRLPFLPIRDTSLFINAAGAEEQALQILNSKMSDALQLPESSFYPAKYRVRYNRESKQIEAITKPERAW